MITYELIKDIHDNAVKHGWYDTPRDYDVLASLFHSELSEGNEEYRKGRPPVYFIRNCKIETDLSKRNNEKPEGTLIELADFVIRILDYCGSIDFDMSKKLLGTFLIDSDEWERVTQTYAHFIAYLHSLISDSYKEEEFRDRHLTRAVDAVIRYCGDYNLDLKSAIMLKHEYNKTREYKHGGKIV